MKNPNLIWLGAIIFLFFVMWLQGGGPNRQSATAGPFIIPPFGGSAAK